MEVQDCKMLIIRLPFFFIATFLFASFTYKRLFFSRFVAALGCFYSHGFTPRTAAAAKNTSVILLQTAAVVFVLHLLGTAVP